MTNPLYSETSEDLSQTARQLEDLIAALQYCEKIAKDFLIGTRRNSRSGTSRP